MNRNDQVSPLSVDGDESRPTPRGLEPAAFVLNMPEACFAVDESWRLTFLNDQCSKLWQRERGEVIGRPLWEALPQVVGTPSEKAFRQVMAKRISATFEAFSTFAKRWLEIRAFPLGEGIAALVLDIAPRKAAEEALRHSATFINDVLDSLSTGVAVLDGEGTIVWVNAAWGAFVGAGEGEEAAAAYQTGRNYLAAAEAGAGSLAHTAGAAALEGVREVLAGRRSEFCLEYPCGAGAQRRWYLLQASPLSSEQPGAVITYEDISERKLAEVGQREVEERLQTVFEHMTEGLVLAGMDGQILHWNPSALRMH